MKEYVMSLFALCVCCAVVEMLAPEGEGGGIGRHIRWMIALCLLCVSISPIASLISQARALPDRLDEWLDQRAQDSSDWEEQYLQRWEDESIRMDVQLASETVAQMLRERFDLLTEDVEVALVTDASGEEVTHVRVALGGRAIWTDTHAMEEYILSTFGWKSTIYMK